MIHPFTRFVINNHPDPDSIYGGKWDEIEKMAEAYAHESFLEGVKKGYYARVLPLENQEQDANDHKGQGQIPPKG